MEHRRDGRKRTPVDVVSTARSFFRHDTYLVIIGTTITEQETSVKDLPTSFNMMTAVDESKSPM